MRYNNQYTFKMLLFMPRLHLPCPHLQRAVYLEIQSWGKTNIQMHDI